MNCTLTNDTIMNVFGLIGYPLTHSFSQQYFTEKFAKESVTGCFFKLFPLTSIDLFPGLITNEKDLRGVAVTVPYKEQVIRYIDIVNDEAKKVGAVNCIRIQAGILTGYNTDIIGFERSVTPLLKSHHTKALVLGAGGASKAVQFVLTKLGIDFLVVTRGGIRTKNFISYQSLDKKLIESYPMIINCTPAGMFPNGHEQPLIPYQFLDERCLLYDLIYSPAETLFLKNGLEKGAAVKNGFEMLVIQAEENWRIWNE